MPEASYGHLAESLRSSASSIRCSPVCSVGRLSVHGEATATELADELPITRQAVVKHLSVLDRVGLVSSHRDGRERRYQVRPGQLIETAQWMNRIAVQWSARLAAIKRIAESGDQS